MQIDIILTLIKMVFLGGWFAMVEGGGVGKITSCLILVRIMLESWNLAHKYTHRFSLRKYTF